MSFLINGKPLAVDTPFTDAENNQYPANWLRLASLEEKTAIGITEVADVDMSFDNRFYWAKDLPKALEDKAEVKEDGTPLMVQEYDPSTNSMVDTGKQVVTKGLKSTFTSQVKQTAGSILSQTDWMVIRKAERNVDITASVVTYRATVVAKADELEAAIAAVTTVEELANLDLSFPTKD
jgi:hypothetical protein